MNIKPVQIASVIHVSKPDNYAILYGNNCSVFQERTIPFTQVNLTSCSNIQLLFGIIFCIYAMYRLIKQFSQLLTVRREIFPKLHISSSQISIFQYDIILFRNIGIPPYGTAFSQFSVVHWQRPRNKTTPLAALCTYTQAGTVWSQ